jgi:hypothetical protein
MIIVDLNASFTPATFDTLNVSNRKALPSILQNCANGVYLLNSEDCAEYCTPYEDGDTLYFQINTGFALTYIGWEITAINSKTGATIWSSVLSTTGISGATVAPTGQNVWFRRTAEGGQNIDFFQFPTSIFAGQDFYLEIKYYDKGILGTDPGVLVGEYVSNKYCNDSCDTLLIESTYDGKDCNGANYGDIFPYIWTPLAGVAIEPAFRNIHRIKAGIEKVDMNYEEREYTSSGRLSRFIANNVYAVKSVMSESAATFMFAVFSGKDLKIDGKEYRFEGSISKNNDDDGLWIIETEVITKCDKSNLC